jgi:plasmid stabilization system protein ParE
VKIVILPSARDDLAEGFEFYEKQCAGLGSYFLESLFSEIDSLRLYAGIHRQVYGFYRLLAARFPYAIYYSAEEGTVLIRAILDCRRDPEQLRRELRR